MLINCPECNKEISNSAKFCINCGYPINDTIIEEKLVKTQNRRNRKQSRRLPNGFGTVKKLYGTYRTKPYAALSAPVDGKRITLGYFATKKEALDCLAKNHNKRIITKNPTFEEVFNMWFEEYKNDEMKKPSDSAVTSYNQGFILCKKIHKRPLNSINDGELQNTLDSIELGISSVKNAKKCINAVYKFAMKRDIIEKDYSRYITIKKENDIEKGQPFTEEEIQILKDNAEGNKYIQFYIILIYTGFRISAFDKKNNMRFNREERYLQGGAKTENAKNRIVPIHDYIFDFVCNFDFERFNSSTYRGHMENELNKLGILMSNGMKHTPHDARHTFSWLCDVAEIDTLTKHILMGHSLGNDVEDNVYGHRTFEQLRIAIDKL